SNSESSSNVTTISPMRGARHSGSHGLSQRIDAGVQGLQVQPALLEPIASMQDMEQGIQVAAERRQLPYGIAQFIEFFLGKRHSILEPMP
ncbi:MAG: hypothetical protein ABI379_13125, partial [Rhodanobacter sp.]